MKKQLTRYRDYDPFREMERMLDTVRSGMMGGYGWPERQAGGELTLNVSEDEKALRIEAALPGMAEDDIDVRVEGNTLTISAETTREAERGGEDRTWHVIERSFGAVRRSLTLPTEVNADEAEAELENGILTITLPKDQPGPLKKIAVKARKAIGSGKEKT